MIGSDREATLGWMIRKGAFHNSLGPEVNSKGIVFLTCRENSWCKGTVMKTHQGNETLVNKARRDKRSGQRGRLESVVQGFVEQHKDFGFFFYMKHEDIGGL